VFEFCELFVLCPVCDNPETVLKGKKERLHRKCRACGAYSEVDATHKLSAFILKTLQPSRGRSRRLRKRRGAEDPYSRLSPVADLPSSSSSSSSDSASSDSASSSRSRSRRMPDSGQSGGSGAAEASPSRPVEASVSGELEEVARNPLAVSLERQDDQLGRVESFDDALRLAAGSIRSWMRENPKATVEATVRQVAAIQQSESRLAPEDRVLVFLTGILSGTSWPRSFSLPYVTAWAEQRLKPAAQVLRALCESATMKRRFIHAIEHLCCVRQPLLKGFFPALLKLALEDISVVGEEDIVGWAAEPLEVADGPSSLTPEMHEEMKHVAAPLLTWLEQGEDESSDEQDEQDDDDDDDDGDDTDGMGDGKAEDDKDASVVPAS